MTLQGVQAVTMRESEAPSKLRVQTPSLLPGDPLLVGSSSNSSSTGTADGAHSVPSSASGHTTGQSSLDGDITSMPGNINTATTTTSTGSSNVPVAICGMALRLPGDIRSGEQFWDFLVNKRDGRCRIPADRYNAAAFHSTARKRTHGVKPDLRAVHDHDQVPDDARESPNGRLHGYFLEGVDLAQFDNSLFSMTRNELEWLDPQQRIMLELTRECFENAGETNWRGREIGCYVGMFTEDWLDLGLKDEQDSHLYMLSGRLDALLPNRISYEYDLRGPSLAVKTACSSSLMSLHLAVKAVQAGEVTSALVGGCNLILSPTVTRAMYEQGVLSPNTSCRTFDADADGYARAEAFNMVYVKRLDEAIRDGNPIRAVIRATGADADGKTLGLSNPSTEAQENLIWATYRAAGIPDASETGFIECHGTGTRAGDPVETKAVAKIWGDKGIYITSVKPNVGHSEGASGLTSIIKSTLALEHRIIPPNIKFDKPNPRIPWEEARLRVPTDPTPWPAGRHERVSINSFGLGGSNVHAILDSAASCGVSSNWSTTNPHHPAATSPPSPSPLPLPPNTQQQRHRLLVFTAGHAESARRGAADLRAYLSSHRGPTTLTDVAHTLGTRREHLAYRSFAVVATTPDSPAPLQEVHFSPPTKTTPTTPPPSITFIFTGQGAQWATMGARLLSEFPSFAADIASMDRALASLGGDGLAPGWKIKEELERPEGESRINQAEFSQPLCTAVQVAVVNLLRSWGVVPAAVVGHSSGEIAAAYAAGGLSMREAVVCAYLRGWVMKQQQQQGAKDEGGRKKGAMAAIGLGRGDVDRYLVEGCVIACENSPQSVTLSGDEDKVELVTERIREANPGVFARRLRVEMAYHSHHMKDLGQRYEELLAAHLKSKAPAVPFCSSVTNEVLDRAGALDAAYWRSNLESPVLFNSALARLLAGPSRNDILLEIGPHSALQGPIRQILKSAKQDNAYFPTLVRGENESASLLNTAGQLFSKGLKLDFLSVNPPGAVLTDLPSYPWHYESHYWHESRLAREWRLREFPHHEMLGSRVHDCSQLEPTWRNVLRLDEVPWCRDHVIGHDVVFPAAGYLVMACEAVRQVTGSADYSLRDCTISSAMILHESATVEVIFSMRPLRLTNSLDSTWWEFTISSYTGKTWVKHATGQIAPGAENRPPTKQIEDLPRKLHKAHWYQVMAKAGLNYGPRFQAMERISTHPILDVGVAHVIDTHDDDYGSSPPHFHPSTIDSLLQLYPTVTAKGLARNFGNLCVPTSIKEIYLRSPGAANLPVTAEVQAELTAKGVIQGDALATAEDGAVVLYMKDVKSTPLDDASGVADRDPHAGVRLVWRPDLDFQDVGQLVRAARRREGGEGVVQRLLLLCCLDAKEKLDALEDGVLEKQSHLVKWHGWLESYLQQADAGNDLQQLLGLSQGERAKLIADHAVQLAKTDMATAASAMLRVTRAVEQFCQGETDALAALGRDADFLSNAHPPADTWDLTQFLRLLSHQRPHLRILEIGAAGPAMAEHIVRSLQADEHGGNASYYSYTYASSSEDAVNTAKESLGGLPRVDFRVLDIEHDLAAQDFPLGGFDLVVAANSLSTKHKLRMSLANVRKLLAPGGMLLMQELCPGAKWINFALGILPTWWVGSDDGRLEEPYVSTERWATELSAAGFATIDACLVDDTNGSSLITASPNPQRWKNRESIKSASLLCSNPTGPFATQLCAALQAHGLTIDCITLTDEEQPKQGVISILDLEHHHYHQQQQQQPTTEETSFLTALSTPTAYNRLRDFLLRAAPHGLLWLTRPCQMMMGSTSAPQYAAAIGLLRTLRTETSAVFASLELELELEGNDDHTAAAVDAISGVYRKVLAGSNINTGANSSEQKGVAEGERGQEGAVDADSEFALSRSNGAVHIPRFEWVSVGEELATRPGAHSPKKLEIGKRGSLKTLQWVESEGLVEHGLQGEEVLLEVRATGMNFKDILIAMGFVDGNKGDGNGLGVECTGVITAVGPAVSSLKVGDRVMALAGNSYSTSLKTLAPLCVRMPDSLSFEDGATMPCVYATVVYGLLDLARLETGQSVLIHSACGGVGIAAIQICRMVGAEIYATVGNEEKAQYLVSTFGIPRDHIFDSRSIGFRAGVMQATQGRGVDVVLNSLSGELLHASWKCVAEFGAMVELGKRDFIGQGRLGMDLFEDNRSFFGVHLAPLCEKKPRAVQRLLERVVRFYAEGHIQPIQPTRFFNAVDVEEAFRVMQKGQHIGKFVVRMPEDPSVLETARARRGFQLPANASYLLVGGLGGLGRSISTWLAEHGAKNLVYLSRSGGAKPEDVELVAELAAAGCEAQIVQGSVTNLADVERAIAAARLPVRGVIQSSMVLRDKLFPDTTYDDWAAVTAPKVAGTWNLDTALARAGCAVDFFVLFSSVSGLIGSYGQASYAAANTFLDAFVQYRHARGLPASVIDIGVMGGVGHVSTSQFLQDQFRAASAYMLGERELLDALELAMRADVSMPSSTSHNNNNDGDDDAYVCHAQLGIGLRSTRPIDSPANRIPWRRDPRMARYRNIEQVADEDNNNTNSTGSKSSAADPVRAFRLSADADPRSLAQPDRVSSLAQLVGETLFGFMMRPLEDLDVAAPMAGVGMDSLVAVELRNWCRQRLGLDVTVLEIVNAQSILALAGHMAEAWMVKAGVGARHGGRFEMLPAAE